MEFLHITNNIIITKIFIRLNAMYNAMYLELFTKYLHAEQ